MALFSGMKLFVIIALNALWPRTKTGGAPLRNAAPHLPSVPPGFTPVAPAGISPILADPGQAVNAEGDLSLFFPGCPALAAPFLLFRLKRLGFSRCRVRLLPEGLALTARR
ncbi:hypothetical protein [Geobacter grbiciae]|uniref:hypothetical protein n=1 Tax=Geobacter grbiciae TaxID=155042 RepID=UPI001C02FC62|nr:hypothetical protein [Geobacter grbiciae]MBT1074279.1 hypothetical protein [Geobacter grbiciae]